MTKEHPESKKGPTGKKIQDAIQELLDRLREGSEELAGLLSPRGRKPALQPVPVPRGGFHRRPR